MDKFFGSIFNTFNDLNISIKNGWLVKDARIIELTADKILANSIFTQFLTVGADENIEIDGVNQFLAIYDENGTLRGKFGNTGAGTTNWGLDLWNSSGSLVFSVADTTFINGAIIQNATITDSKIDGMSTSKLIGLVNDAQLNSISATKITGQVVNTQIANIAWAKITGVAITNADILNLSASKINAGTLTVDGSPAIQVISSGDVNFFNGSDIIFRASSSGNTSYTKFQTSGGSQRGTITLVGGSAPFQLVAYGGADLQLGTVSGGDVNFAPTGGGDATCGSDFLPTSDGIYDLGVNVTAQWDTLHADATSVPDILFQNGWYLCEGYAYGESDEDYLILFDNEDNLRSVWTKNAFYCDNIKPLSECPLFNKTKGRTISDALREKDDLWEHNDNGWIKKYKKYADGKIVRTDGTELEHDKIETLRKWQKRQRAKKNKGVILTGHEGETRGTA